MKDPEDLRNLIAELLELKLAAARALVESYWQFGLRVNELNRAYGDHVVEQHAKKVGLSRASLYNAARFRRIYPEQTDLERVLQRGLSWSHVRCLLRRKLTPQQRGQLELLVERDAPSVKALKKQVQTMIDRHDDDAQAAMPAADEIVVAPGIADVAQAQKRGGQVDADAA